MCPGSGWWAEGCERHLAAACPPALQQPLELGAQLLKRSDPLLNFPYLCLDRGLQVAAGAHPQPPGLQDAPAIGQGDLHGLEGADQGKLGKHVVAVEAIAALGATDRNDQALVAVKADGFHRQPGAGGHLADAVARCGGRARRRAWMGLGSGAGGGWGPFRSAGFGRGAGLIGAAGLGGQSRGCLVGSQMPSAANRRRGGITGAAPQRRGAG